MTNYFDLELPADESVATRIEWAGERYADLAEGLLTPDVGWFIWQYIVGWTDLCTDEERRQYNAIAKNISDLLRANEDANA